MSILTDVQSGISKGVSFILKVFTKTSAVAGVLVKCQPQTIAAVLAVFYDVMKFVTLGGSVAALFKTGEGAVAVSTIFSTTTQQLLTQLETDLKAGETVIVNDITELGIAFSTTSTATASTPTAAEASKA